MSVNKQINNNSNTGNSTTEASLKLLPNEIRDEDKLSSKDEYTESAELEGLPSAVEGLFRNKQESEPHATMDPQPDDCCMPRRACKIKRRRPKCPRSSRPKRRRTCRPKRPRKCRPRMRKCRPKCRPRRKRCSSRR